MQRMLVRNYLLQITDWTQLSDVDLTEEEKSAWAVYRAALREIKFDTPNPQWPVPPKKFVFIEEIPWFLDPQTRMDINLQ